MKKPRCPACKGKHFIQGIAPDGRPQFQCLDGARCGKVWTAGHNGYPYAGHGVKVRPA